ncbi:adenosylcobinamide-phosphate synthase CbiB [Halodurantibacterium flavum]|uniref:Cobalamin biosynthesis protein CobD n=1 Tax=Halodurantibacterium flavum TaxID=1382802 RepID=A0ABW4S1L9_9RHOB
MSFAAMLFLALLLDAAMGEPRWLWQRLPHPAVLMGRAVGWCDARFNHGAARKARGIAVMLALGLGALFLGGVLSQLPAPFQIVIAAILLAQRSLVDHVRAVAAGLRMGLPEGRRMVARIVSRDTAPMDETAVARSAIESGAENLSDGVIAPAFWFLILGLPGLLLYKITNTADSMIGYRTPRHQDFGWAAARFDDLLNWVPARLTAILIAAAHLRADIWPLIRRDAALHRSPNAGWPEAAMAPVLGVALAGPRSYDGRMQDFPFVHPEGRRTLDAADVEAACHALWRTWAVALGVVGVLALV